MKVNKKINGVFQEVEITSDMEEFEGVTEEEKNKIIKKEEKEKDLEKIKELSEKSANLRAKYLAVKLLPRSKIKTQTMRKLSAKTKPIIKEFEELISNFIKKYKENPIDLII